MNPTTVNYLQPVLDWLDAGAPHHTKGKNFHFNMEFFSSKYHSRPDSCGTACCIAGALDQFHGFGVGKTIVDSRDACLEIGKRIGLTKEQARDLFLPLGPTFKNVDLSEITPAAAAAAIRSLIETGTPKWYFER